jgi:serpin B
MKKFLITFIIISLVLIVAGIARLTSGPKDVWVCEKNGVWVKYGDPKWPMPIGGCGDVVPIDTASSTPKEVLDESGATDAGVQDTVKKNNEFAWKLFGLSDVGGMVQNAFVSPWSISSALVMTYEGAKGTTAQEMAKAMHFSTNETARRTSFAKIANTINMPSANYELNTANALWAQKDFTFLPTYFDTVGKYYGGKVTNVDFKQNTEGSRTTINTWVEKQTKDKIKDLLPKGSVTPDTRLVLTNAVYFKGKWAEAFKKENTQEEDFNTEFQVQCIKAPCYPILKPVKVSMMHKTESFGYFEDANVQALSMPYKGNELSMVVFLPKLVNKHYVNLTEKFSADTSYPTKIMNLLSQEKVIVSLPKFKFEKKLSLVPTLQQLGMQSAFSGTSADFSGMDGTKNLSISDVIHQAYIDVNEEGTEAAAATGVIVGVTSMPIDPKPTPEFRADHPFVFVIKENTTGQILFMGKVNDPTAK